MAEEEEPKQKKVRPDLPKSGPNSAIYGLGFLGALIYYLTHSPTIWAGLLGILKALFWPAFLVYELLKGTGA